MTGFGDDVRRRRLDAGLPLRELARRAHLDPGYLSKIEAGKQTPSDQLAALLDHTLGAAGDLAALLRRDSIHLPDWGELESPPGVRAGADPAAVDMLAKSLALHRQMEDYVGAQAVLLPVLAQAATVAAQRAATRGQVHDDLLRLEAEHAQFVGWLYQDLGQASACEQWYARALDRGHEVGDDNMVASVLSMRSNVAWEAGDGPRAARLAQASCRQTRATSGVLALSWQQLARGLALIGDRSGRDKALVRAERLMARAVAHRDGEPSWIYFADEQRLAIQRAMCLRDSGDYAEAIRLFTAAIAELPAGFRRDQGTYLSRLALTYALAGERDGAMETAARARGLAEAMGSVRALAELRRVDEVLAGRTS